MVWPFHPQKRPPPLMLIQPNSGLLGDKVLDLKEDLARSVEETKKKAAASRIPDQALLENREMAQGWKMEWTELIRRLQKLNYKILCLQGGVSDAIAVRYATVDEVGQPESKYITGFYKTTLPEYDSIPTDPKTGLPKKGLWGDEAVRGWRSILMALVKAGALTLKQVDLTFGPPTGQRSVLWERTMQARR